MIRDDVCYLITENPSGHGVFDTPSRTERMVYCTVRSVYSADYWRAQEQGLDPQIVFVLSDYGDYNGERLIKYDSRYWRVVRTYVDNRAIELTCEQAEAYVVDPPPSEGDNNNVDGLNSGADGDGI